MEKTTYIQIKEFCAHHDIEVSFVRQLQEYEIVHIVVTDNEMMIPENELSKLEKMVRLYHDLQINPEGLQAIHHLLEKVDHLQHKLSSMRRKLNRLEK